MISTQKYRWFYFQSLMFFSVMTLAVTAAAGVPIIPVPPDSSVKTVSKTLNLDGLPLIVQQFESNLSPSKILSFYQKKWARPLEGHPGYLKDKNESWEVISRLEKGYLLTVQVRARGRKKSWGYLAVGNMGEYLFEPSPDREVFPAMRGSNVLNSTLSDDPGFSGQTLVIQNDFSANSNANFYKNHFTQKGWSLDQDLASDRNTRRLLRLTNAGQEISLIIHEQKGTTQIVANKVQID